MDCRIFRRASRAEWHLTGSGRTVHARTWVAVCDCGEEIRPSVYNNGRWLRTGVTRKVAKDALYRHRREAHHS